jgi:hypothetical protein
VKSDADIERERAELQAVLGPTKAAWYVEACTLESPPVIAESDELKWACRYRETVREAARLAQWCRQMIEAVGVASCQLRDRGRNLNDVRALFKSIGEAMRDRATGEPIPNLLLAMAPAPPRYCRPDGTETSADDPARTVWYGMCTFWSDDWNKLPLIGTGIPVCPVCRGVGFQLSAAKWLGAAEAYQRDGPAPRYVEFLTTYHKEKCYGRQDYAPIYQRWLRAQAQQAGQLAADILDVGRIVAAFAEENGLDPAASGVAFPDRDRDRAPPRAHVWLERLRNNRLPWAGFELDLAPGWRAGFELDLAPGWRERLPVLLAQALRRLQLGQTPGDSAPNQAP